LATLHKSSSSLSLLSVSYSLCLAVGLGCSHDAGNYIKSINCNNVNVNSQQRKCKQPPLTKISVDQWQKPASVSY